MKTLITALLLVFATTLSATTLDDVKLELAKTGRSLSTLTAEELAEIDATPGGFFGNLTNSEYVMKIGTSTFIVNVPAITGVGLVSILTVLLFFTPIGFALFRGKVHSFVGSILSGLRIAPEFGEHMKREPMKWLRRERSARKAFALYMHNDFIQQYKNNITAIAFIGTAFLILNIGLRGVKFMVAHQPDMIVIAILVEITVLCLLGLTTWYEKTIDKNGTGLAEAGLQKEEIMSILDDTKDKIAHLN